MKNLSVLIVGKKGILTWQEDLRDAFRKLGCRCEVFYVNPNSLSELYEKKRLGTIPFQSEAFRGRFRRHILKYRPQLILFLNLFVLPKVFFDFIDSITPEDTIKVGWMADCVDRIPFTDYKLFQNLFYFDSFMHPFLKKLYKAASKIVFLPLAVNEHRYFDQGRVRKNRLLFAGSCSEERLKIFKQLKKKVPLDYMGPRCRALFGMTMGLRLSSTKLNNLYNAYAVCLNINQKPNTMNGLNLRPFEVTAAGSVVFNENVPDLSKLFIPEKEILVYRSTDELTEKFAAISKNKPLIEKVAESGFRRTLSEHTFVHRARFIIRHLGL